MPLLSRGSIASPSRQHSFHTLLAWRCGAPTSRPRSLVTPLARRSISSLPNLPLFRALQDHDQSNLAVVHSASARSFTYGNLVADVLQAKDRLLHSAGSGKDGLSGERVAFLAENSYDYVGTVTTSCMMLMGYSLTKCTSDAALHPRQRCHCPSAVPRLPHGRIEVYHG